MNTLARRRHDAVPQREEHELGGRLPRPRDDPLAGPRSPPAVVSNEIIQHHDWLPTFLAAAGEPDIVEKLKAGHTIGDTTYKVHIDGYNLLPYLTGEVDKSPRKGMVYFSDDGDVLALRFDNWKVVFMEQRVHGTLQIWAEPFVACACPSSTTCGPTRTSAPTSTSNTYYDWLFENDYLALAATALVGAVPADVRGVPAAPEGRELHHRPGGRQARERPDLGPMSSPSWNDGAARTAILDFVDRVTEEGGTDFVPPAERVAVLDNDGTLWCEKPTYIQALFVFARLREAVATRPELAEQPVVKALLAGDLAAAQGFGMEAIAGRAARARRGPHDRGVRGATPRPGSPRPSTRASACRSGS